MRKLVSVITIFTLSIFLVSCGGGSSSSGVSLNLTGTYRVVPLVTGSPVLYVPLTAVLQQSGNKVVSTSFIENSLPPGSVLCSPGKYSISGTTSGNTLSGTATASAWDATFSVSGNSSSLSGTFTINYHSGICSYVGTETGTVTFTKI